MNVVFSLRYTENPLNFGNHLTRFESLQLKRGPNLAQDYFIQRFVIFWRGTGLKHCKAVSVPSLTVIPLS